MTSMTRKRPLNGVRIVASVLAASFAILLGCAPAAQAATPTIEFTSTSATVEFGQEWSFNLKLEYSGCAYYLCPEFVTLAEKGTAGSLELDAYQNKAYLGSYLYDTLKSAGTHSYSAKFTNNRRTATTSAPAVLTVTPAALAVDLRVASVDTVAGAAVVNAQLTGDYIDNYPNCYACRTTGESPAGTWTFTIMDAAGKTVANETITAAKTESRFASFYWSGIPSDSDFTANATFTAEGKDAGNFAITNESDVAYTSDPAAAAGPGIPDEPVVEAPAATGTTVPLWALLGAGLVFIALLATAVVLAVRGRRPRIAPAEVPLEIVEGSVA
jgi:hypothetical protein